ncbi:F420-dependent oxidoreductase-like protein [Actinocorallia herbida]|uniref:F420-dependent oxidoreductase-like protein n=1 Tax=Actinocorallia herbida TaxID=58109 RepID=A0A3N1CVE9_9ACTN|nr:LLM class F420-dependent oxidoreductase [Actinocorallia herbida]ROO85280.1 F420-dependent oxidoreductase-like protein [Actinocorallia herbida]
MKIGIAAGYWTSRPPRDVDGRLAAAEEAGVESFWTAETYGSDAIAPLSWWGARTGRMRLGTAVCQMSARTPTALAMAAQTVDHLSGGRMVLGIGASGPQVVEGWYGQPYPRPLERTREYVEIMRRVWAREEPVRFEGKHYRLPYQGGAGLGKPLRSTVHPVRRDVPVHLGAEGPKNVALAAEIADGWIPLWFSPKSDDFYRAALAEGFARPGARRGAEDFEVAGVVWAVEGEDVEAAAAKLKPTIALYVGGMGAKGTNFHLDVFERMGWGEECARIQDLYLAGRKQEAADAVPTAMVEDVALVGPAEKICDDLKARWLGTCLTTLVLGGWPRAELCARLVETAAGR